MLMAIDKGNLEAAFGIVGVVPTIPAPVTDMVMVIVKPGFEQKARDSLRRRAVGTWWPNYRREIPAKDRDSGKRISRTILSGVMPGIVLARATLDDAFWRAMDLAPSVINIGRKFGGEPLILGELHIVIVHKIEEGLNKPPLAKPVHSFKPKDKVRFTDDAMRRFPPAIVTKCQRDGHIELEVNTMGRMTPFTVLPHQIELA